MELSNLGYAILTICYLINHIPSSKLDGQIPYSLLCVCVCILYPHDIWLYVLCKIIVQITPNWIQELFNCISLKYTRTQKGCNSITYSMDVSFSILSPISIISHPQLVCQLQSACHTLQSLKMSLYLILFLALKFLLSLQILKYYHQDMVNQQR